MDGNIALRSWMSTHTSTMTLPCRTVNFLFSGCKNLGKNVELHLPIKYYMYAESIIIMNTSGSQPLVIPLLSYSLLRGTLFLWPYSLGFITTDDAPTFSYITSTVCTGTVCVILTFCGNCTSNI